MGVFCATKGRDNLIKVIASDLDGTLLNENHTLSERTIEAIHKAQEKGIRFMIATGRSFQQAMTAFENVNVVCDYIVSSGGEVRNPKKEILFSKYMKLEDYKSVYDILKQYELVFLFNSNELDYGIGNSEEMEEKMLEQFHIFHQTMPKEGIKENPLFKQMLEKTVAVPDFETLCSMNPQIVKMIAFSENVDMLKEIKQKLQSNSNLAVVSSFSNNLEITDVTAQKGPVVKKYIESLGYSMDEVMVFGDSLNDYSMLSMDFGATVAMENADSELKKVAKYITKSNIDDGVAYTIEKLLEE